MTVATTTNRSASAGNLEQLEVPTKIETPAVTTVKDIEAGVSEDDSCWNGEKKCKTMAGSFYWNPKVIIAVLCYVAFVLWALSDTLISNESKVKYMLMDPITKLWVQIGNPLSRLLKSTPITPNQISFFHLFVAFISCFFVASTNWHLRRLGAILYMIRDILDCTDGALARLRAASSGQHLQHEHILDLDFITDSTAALMYGVAVVIYFKRIGVNHPRGSAFFLGMCALTVFLKGFAMDYFMDSYEALRVEPSLLASFLWKISSYDSWDNLKLFALLSMTEYKFFEFTGYFGLLWVLVPSLVSLVDLYGLPAVF